MATTTIEEFARLLRTAVGEAQAALAAGHPARVGHDVQLNGDSEVEGEHWSIKVRLPADGSGRERMVSLPLASFQRIGETRITRFSLETTAVVEPVWTPDATEAPEYVLRLGRPKSRRHKLVKLVVDILGINLDRVEVRINDRLLKVFRAVSGDRDPVDPPDAPGR